MTDETATLPVKERKIHRALMLGLLSSGELPSRDELAEAAGVDFSQVSSSLLALAEADYLSVDGDERITCLYPLSPTPTPHIVAFDSVERYAMCAIDALGMAAMLDRAVSVSSACPVCQTPILLEVSPGTISRVEPEETVVIAGRDVDRPARESCCPHTLFACCSEHGERFAAQLPKTHVMPPEDALTSGEEIFGRLLGETLPAKRPRIQRVDSNGSA